MDYRIWLIAIGIFLVFEGTPYLIAPGGMKKMLLALRETPDANLRAMGGLAVAVGLGVLAWIRFGS